MLHYVSYDQSCHVPNIIVDGAANEASELVLSHWPGNETPEPLKDDLSAQIALNYLSSPDFHVTAEAVSNNHFDADGLVGIYSLLNGAEALAQKGLLVDIAQAGDFDRYNDRDAARVSFVLDAWTDPIRSPLKESIFAQDYPSVANILYEELLPRLPNIIEKIDHLEKYWLSADQLLEATEEALTNGSIKIEAIPDIDLAIVYIPESNLSPLQNVHKMAIHNRTDHFRILLMQENKFELYYRYETWIELRSRPTLPRIELQPLALTLTKQESMDGKWSAGSINDLTPHLKLSGSYKSIIVDQSFKEQVIEYLRDAPIAAKE